MRTLVVLAALSFAAAVLPNAARADACQARFSNAPCYTGAPNLALARSFVDAAGGVGHTSTMTLLGVLAGSRLGAVQQAMETKYGKDAFADYVTASDFAMQDSAETLASLHFTLAGEGIALAQRRQGALRRALVRQATFPKGSYDYEYMLDRMLGHATHAKVMDDIDAKYGKKFDAYYHVIFNAVMENIHALA